MKNFSILFLVVTFCSIVQADEGILCGLPEEYSKVVRYESAHPVTAAYYTSKEDCEKDSGKWDSQGDLAGLCVFDAADGIEIRTLKNTGEKYISVDTITTNFHLCNFEGPAKKVGFNTYVATSDSDECEVTVKISPLKRYARVTDNGNCSSFCGANGMLGIEKAKKVKAKKVSE